MSESKKKKVEPQWANTGQRAHGQEAVKGEHVVGFLLRASLIRNNFFNVAMKNAHRVWACVLK